MQPELIICEQTGQWAAAWRRMGQRSGRQLPLREVRRIEECRRLLSGEQLATMPNRQAVAAAFVLVELTADNAAEALELLDWLQFDWMAARAAVLARRDCRQYEFLAREMGAVHYVDSPRRLKPLVRVVERWLAQQSSPEEAFGESIWRRLPWESAAVLGPDVLAQFPASDVKIGEK